MYIIDLDQADNSLPSSLSVQPSTTLDFGCLKPGTEARNIIEIHGGPASIFCQSDRIILTPSSIDSKSAEIEITLKPHEHGEVLWDKIVITKGPESIEISIMAIWDDNLELSQISDDDLIKDSLPASPQIDPTEQMEQHIPTISTVQVIEPGANPTQYKYRGQICLCCGRNLAYDCTKRTWITHSKCTGLYIPFSIACRVGRGIIYCAKETKKTAIDFWEVMTGKQDLLNR